MLKKYITLLLIAFAGYGLNAQCPPGDVILSSQAEVDAFVADYPNCTEIAGNMLIGSLTDNTDIIDISGLSPLTAIEGSLSIDSNVSLTSLTGLDQLTSRRRPFHYLQPRLNEFDRIGPTHRYR